MTKSKFTNEQIIEAYRATGSVWRAAKILGLAGQTVHERLQAIGYQTAGAKWSDEELAELNELANEMTIAQIANKLGRPYNGVAIKISRLGIGQRFGNNQKKKPPRTKSYLKSKIAEYIKEIDETGVSLTAFSKRNGLKVDTLNNAVQNYFPDWWNAYVRKNAVKPAANCPYCGTEFFALSHKQIFCSRKCANDSRVDLGYFGGKRRETYGLAEKTCQLCGRQNVKGLSSHHMKGKENDRDNEFLIALCPGCHQIVSILGGRNFAGTSEVWESLIQLVLIRKNGHVPDYLGCFVYVDIQDITESNKEQFDL